jgi:hypothetical protein
MPSSDEQYTPYCSDCLSNYASCFCDECNRLFCESCFTSFHKSGVRKTHTKLVLEMCIECAYQVPTKQCLPCDEIYCDTCFHYAHRRGRSRLHTYRWVAEVCDTCGIRAAHWRHVDSWASYKEELLCTICYKATWGEPSDIDNTGQFGTYPVAYFGPTVLRYRKQKEEEEEERKKAEGYAKLMAENLVRKREKSAVTIQRVHRGRMVRKTIENFLLRRRAFLANRLKEMPQRQTRLYRTLDVFGFAPKLKYDTNKEKILRVFPQHLRNTVTDCVDRKWGFYTELLKPPDLGSAFVDESSKAEGALALSSLLLAKAALSIAERRVKSAERGHANARDRYRQVRA